MVSASNESDKTLASRRASRFRRSKTRIARSRDRGRSQWSKLHYRRCVLRAHNSFDIISASTGDVLVNFICCYRAGRSRFHSRLTAPSRRGLARGGRSMKRKVYSVVKDSVIKGSRKQWKLVFCVDISSCKVRDGIINGAARVIVLLAAT